VSCRSVPKRSSFGGWYMTAPTGSWSSLAIAAPGSATVKTSLKVGRTRRRVNGANTGKALNPNGFSALRILGAAWSLLSLDIKIGHRHERPDVIIRITERFAGQFHPGVG